MKLRIYSTVTAMSLLALVGFVTNCKPRLDGSAVKSGDAQVSDIDDYQVPDLVYAKACSAYQTGGYAQNVDTNFYTKNPRAFISLAAEDSCILQDYLRQDSFKRLNFRYLTLTHFFNGKTEGRDQKMPINTKATVGGKPITSFPLQTQRELSAMARYRAGISKALNSLSWQPKIANPVFVDPAGLIMRIDITAYNWTADKWDKFYAEYPFIRTSNQQVARLTMRGDYFIAVGTTFPLYHDLLDLGTTDVALEKQVFGAQNPAGDIVEQNIQAGKVIRAGFVASGVSVNNRLLERHETSFGAYWKSYDFSNAASEQNFFENPNGPCFRSATPRVNLGQKVALFHTCAELGTDIENFKKFRVFKQAGGEVIWNLLNGLQGYLLLEGTGHRINSGPPNIVANRNDSLNSLEVHNAVSCMYCHYAGIIDNQVDQVGKKVSAEFLKTLDPALQADIKARILNTDNFRIVNDKVRAVLTENDTLTAGFANSVYPNDAELAKTYATDVTTFRAAELKAVGTDPLVTIGTPDQEPVNFLYRRFFTNVDQAMAAAEFYMPATLYSEAAKEVTDAESQTTLQSLRDGQTSARQRFDVVTQDSKAGKALRAYTVKAGFE